jgi:hypothetical protein
MKKHMTFLRLSLVAGMWVPSVRSMPRRITVRVNACSDLDETRYNFREPKIHFETLEDLDDTSRQLLGRLVNITPNYTCCPLSSF